MFVKDRSTTLEINSLATLIYKSFRIHSFHLSESVSDDCCCPNYPKRAAKPQEEEANLCQCACFNCFTRNCAIGTDIAPFTGKKFD